MENDSAFRPSGPTYLLTANVAPPTPVQIQGGGGDVSILAVNTDATNILYLAYGATAAQATANAVVPTAGNPQQVLLVRPSTDRVFTLTPGLFYTGVAAGAVIFTLTPGNGR